MMRTEPVGGASALPVSSVPPDLVSMILASAERAPATPMRFVARDGTVTLVGLAELVESALGLAGALRSRGLRAGDVVAVRGANTLAYSRAVLASLFNGLVTLPLVSLLGDRDVADLLDLSGARALMSERRGLREDLTGHLLALAANRPTLDVLLLDDGPEVPGCVTLMPGVPCPVDEFPAGRAPAFLLFTSGTTSVPKGVLHGYGSLAAEVHDFAADLDLTADGHLLQGFPLGHVAGLDCLLMCTALGREMTMLEAWSAETAADAIERYGVTAMGSTPFYATTLFDEFDRRGWPGWRPATLRTMQSGGGAVGEKLVRRAEQYGIVMVRAYGSTEHPTATSHSSAAPLEVRAVSDGTPTGDTEVRIVGDDGLDASIGAEGEVWLRGTEQFLGYLSGDTGDLPEEGWFRTGDLGVLDGDGRLRISGRKKDIVIRGGENISVSEIEELLLRSPDIADAAVVGVPDERYGERVHAFVVARDGAKPIDLDRVRVHFSELGVARHKTPELVDQVAELPRNALGKVQKHLLLSPQRSR